MIKPMQYRAIIFDLDGTAVPNKMDTMPSKRLIKSVARAQEHIILCAATGRPITNAAAILKALNLKHPCVISAGTQIVNMDNEEILWEVAIEQEDIRKIVDICLPYDYEILTGNELVGEGKTAKNYRYHESPTVLYIMSCSQADAAKILERLEAIPTITAVGVTSWTKQGIDIHITHRNATKEHAIGELLRLIGVGKAETIGVGDANNDVHLFKAVGYKVAMGNATELLKSQADEVCKSVDEDGLADIIDKYSSINRV